MNLRQYAQHQYFHCLVVDQNKRIEAFVTFGVMGHPIQPGLVGEVEELYVKASVSEKQIAEQLLHQAVVMMQQQGAGVITTRVSVDEPEQLTFWKGQNWEQETLNFTIYGDIPSDPDGQAIWDSYQQE